MKEFFQIVLGCALCFFSGLLVGGELMRAKMAKSMQTMSGAKNFGPPDATGEIHAMTEFQVSRKVQTFQQEMERAKSAITNIDQHFEAGGGGDIVLPPSRQSAPKDQKP